MVPTYPSCAKRLIVSVRSVRLLMLCWTMLAAGCGKDNPPLDRSSLGPNSTATFGPLPENWPKEGSPERKIAEEIVVARQGQNLVPLTAHEVLQTYAERFAAATVRRVESSGEGGNRPDQAALQEVKQGLPGISRLSLQVQYASSFDELRRRLTSGPAARSADLTHLGLKIVESRSGGGSRWVGIILGARLPPVISPDLVTEGHREFNLRCFLCGYETPIRLRSTKADDADCLIAECPNCGCAIDFYGMDQDGHYHRPSWFMRHFKPSVCDDPLDAWSLMLETCKANRKRLGRSAGWQTAEQTWRDSGGDGKDLSILLADWLAACGHDAKVVIGRINGNPGAWVVVQAKGNTYILDPIAGHKGARRMPPRAELLTNYVASLQFDQTGIVFRRSTGWTGQYHGTDQWQRGPWPLEPAAEETSNK